MTWLHSSGRAWLPKSLKGWPCLKADNSCSCTPDNTFIHVFLLISEECPIGAVTPVEIRPLSSHRFPIWDDTSRDNHLPSGAMMDCTFRAGLLAIYRFSLKLCPGELPIRAVQWGWLGRRPRVTLRRHPRMRKAEMWKSRPTAVVPGLRRGEREAQEIWRGKCEKNFACLLLHGIITYHADLTGRIWTLSDL